MSRNPSSEISLRLAHLSFAYTDAVSLIEDATLHLTVGWTGLVGGNGCGKSTLLRLLEGELAPTGGQVLRQPADLVFRLCRQSVEDMTPETEAFGEDWSGDAQRLRGLLRLAPEDLYRWPTLSPGERKRWQIGAALASEPDALLLDEPTNHLDSEGRELLTGALRAFRGLGLVVSHDRTFLGDLTRQTLRLSGGELRLWPGSYEEARALWQEEQARYRESYERVRKEEKKLRRRLADKRRQREAAGRAVSRRGVSPKDHDALSMASKSRDQDAETGLGRQVGVLRRQVEKAARETDSFELRRAKGRALFVDFEPAPFDSLLTVDCDRLEAGGEPLLRDVRLAVRRRSRLWLRGPNGSGKSTLLAALMAGSRLPPERVLHLPQELGRDEARRLLEEIRGLEPSERGRVLELVAALGVDPELLLASEQPSPGEARKLALAYGLGRRVWALLLDEPTNHLDLPSIERLEETLADYPGALVLITHDPDLARSATDSSWSLRDGRVELESLATAPIGTAAGFAEDPAPWIESSRDRV